MEGCIDKEGTVSWLMTECGLLDAHVELNTGPSPRTYRHGSRHIDQIYVSDWLLVKHVVLQTIIGDFDSFFTSDHRLVLMDIDAATYFGEDTVEGVPQQVSILHYRDPRLLKTNLTVIAALKGVHNQKLDEFVFELANRE